MRETSLEILLQQLKMDDISVDDALNALKEFFYEDIIHAKVDHHRALRGGMPEVIFGPGKTPEQAAEIALALWKKGTKVLITRSTKDQFTAVRNVICTAEFYDTARLITSSRVEAPMDTSPQVAVLSAGTADIAVAEEAGVTLEYFGVRVSRIYDVGVAGLHRLIDNLEPVRNSRAVIVAAGMDGALPSVVAGLIDVPVIAVPTSSGYGASFSGLAALLTMLNSCAAGVAVVNIDNGFGAAAFAHTIIHSGGI